jgi:hypothetical protein
MCCNDKKAKKDKKCVLYYDITDKTGNFIFSKTATHTNADGSIVESEEIQKMYVLKDKNGVVKGEAQFYDHIIIHGKGNGKENITFYTDLFKFSFGGVDEQYNLLVIAPAIPSPLVKTVKLTNTAGKASFTHLKWDFSKPRRKLTFYRKSE